MSKKNKKFFGQFNTSSEPTLNEEEITLNEEVLVEEDEVEEVTEEVITVEEPTLNEEEITLNEEVLVEEVIEIEEPVLNEEVLVEVPETEEEVEQLPVETFKIIRLARLYNLKVDIGDFDEVSQYEWKLGVSSNYTKTVFTVVDEEVLTLPEVLGLGKVKVAFKNQNDLDYRRDNLKAIK
jgi:hypothetical protein